MIFFAGASALQFLIFKVDDEIQLTGQMVLAEAAVCTQSTV